jgi:hypothetical protein
VQTFAAGDEKRRVPGAVEPATDARRGGPDELLAVVEDDEAAAARRDRVAELHAGVALAERDVERERDDEEDSLERARFREVAEIDAARPLAEPSPAVAADEPRLAGAARAEDGEQARSCIEPRRDRGEVGGPADERIALARQVVSHVAYRLPAVVAADDAIRLVGVVGQRRRRGAVATREFEELDRLGDALQLPMAAAFDGGRRDVERIAERRPRRLREQRLAAARE